MRTPKEILAEINRLERLREYLIARSEAETILYQRYSAKIDALRWVLTEKL